jgi:hypothetical protein
MMRMISKAEYQSYNARNLACRKQTFRPAAPLSAILEKPSLC